MKQKRLIRIVIAELSSVQLGICAAAVHYLFPIFLATGYIVRARLLY